MAGGIAYKWEGSSVKVLTGYTGSGSPSPTISAITQASPPVVTSTAHGLTDGDVVKITGAGGMTEVNGKTFIIEELSANTFSLLGVDGTGYGAYTSGGVFDEGAFSNWCQLTNYNQTGGTKPEIPTTTICSDAAEFLLGLRDFGTTSLDYLFAPLTDTIQVALNAFDASGAIMAVRVELPDGGGTLVQLGFVQQTSAQAGNGTVWTGTTVIRNTGARWDFA